MSVPPVVRRLGTAISGGLVVALALALPATAQAWTNSNHFYNQHRTIECKYFSPLDGYAYAELGCVNFANHRYATIERTGRAYTSHPAPAAWGFSRYAVPYVLHPGQIYFASESHRSTG